MLYFGVRGERADVHEGGACNVRLGALLSGVVGDRIHLRHLVLHLPRKVRRLHVLAEEGVCDEGVVQPRDLGGGVHGRVFADLLEEAQLAVREHRAVEVGVSIVRLRERAADAAHDALVERLAARVFERVEVPAQVHQRRERLFGARHPVEAVDAALALFDRVRRVEELGPRGADVALELDEDVVDRVLQGRVAEDVVVGCEEVTEKCDRDEAVHAHLHVAAEHTWRHGVVIACRCDERLPVGLHVCCVGGSWWSGPDLRAFVFSYLYFATP